MGSGKSTLSKVLAKQLDMVCLDTDAIIESEANKTITEIFKSEGERYFRDLESKVLLDVCASNNSVIATGGGLPCKDTHMELINATGISFYLYHKTEILAERLYIEKSSRPLINHYTDINDLSEFINKQLIEREKFYFQSHYILDANQGINQLVSDIETFIR